MINPLSRIAVAACLATLSLSCSAQSAPADNPWNGSWKTTTADMRFEGALYTIKTDAAGYSISLGGKEVMKSDCFTKPFTNPSGSVTTCVKAANGLTSTTIKDGKTVSVVHLTASADGKKMTREAHNTPPEDSPFTVTLLYERVGTGKGILGDWKETSFSESQDTGILGIQVTGDSVAFKETDSSKPIVCKLDGTITALPGTGKMSVTLVDPHTLKVRYMNGEDKLVRENTFVLSLDGKMISETDFTADPTPSGMTQLFRKM